MELTSTFPKCSFLLLQNCLVTTAALIEDLNFQYTQHIATFLNGPNGFLTFPVRLCAPLDQPDGVLGELAEGVHELNNLVHDGQRGGGGGPESGEVTSRLSAAELRREERE